jgi:cell division protein ZipA
VSTLRWTLLILGGAFIAALALWERLRPRQARGQDVPSAPAPLPPTLNATDANPVAAGEPYIGEVGASADTLAHLPTMLLEEEEPIEPRAVEPRKRRAPQTATDPAQELQGVAEGVGSVRVIEPTRGSAVPGSPSRTSPPAASARAAQPEPEPEPEPRFDAVGAVDLPPLVLEWPAEAERHIIALRVVAGAERFCGRTLRLALAAAGFRLGPLDIFHRPDELGRAVLSAASLTRPGTFDLDSMDAQRYAGLNLFAVLPGPLPAAEAFEMLLAAAENLNERLQGVVEDERGEALTCEGIESLRAALAGRAGGEGG